MGENDGKTWRGKTWRDTERNHDGEQGVSQDLEIGCPHLLEISKQGVQIVHLTILLHVNDR